MVIQKYKKQNFVSDWKKWFELFSFSDLTTLRLMREQNGTRDDQKY